MKARHLFRLFAWLPGALLALTLLPATSGATVLAPWGPNLQDPGVVATLDTANGSFGNSNSPQYDAVNPENHDGADFTTWNDASAYRAPQGGQALEVNIKGCAREDTSAPTQSSAGVPVNQINFQVLTPQSDGSYKADVTAAGFQLPFCSNSNTPADSSAQVNTSTITTFHPVHMCLAAGDVVSFYDIGGFIPAQGAAGPWYPQGVPFFVLGGSGGGISSFADADQVNPTPSHPSTPLPTYSPGETGWGVTSSRQVLLQVVEGVGEDAYGICPGGKANEPNANSNQITCVFERNSPEGYPTCDGETPPQPVYPPANTSAPTVSGTPQAGKTLSASNGSWTNSPYAYHYQWEDCSSTGANCSSIASATRWQYTLGTADVGHTVRVTVSASNQAADTKHVASSPTAVVTSGSGSSSSSSSGSTSGLAPVITHLKLNPRAFPTNLGSTITYHTSESGRTLIRVLNRKGKVVRTIIHRDRAGNNGIGHKLTGLRPGRYRLKVVSSYNGHTSRAWTLTFTVRGKRK